MKPTIFFTGPDDAGRSVLKMKDGKPSYAVTVGTLPLHALIERNKKIKKNSAAFVLSISKQLKLGRQPKSINAVNLVGDPIQSKQSLKGIETLLKHKQFDRVINHPKYVYRTSREQLPFTLANIPNVETASVQSFVANDFDELASKIAVSGFGYPIIVRVPGYHNSQYMARFDSEQALMHFSEWKSETGKYLVSEFIDTILPNQRYQKMRVAVVDGKFYPQHLFTSLHWNVSGRCREELMLEDPTCREDEFNYFTRFHSHILPRFRTQLKAIDKAIGLDIYGIDCYFKDDNSVVVYEANMCMNLLALDITPNNEYEYTMPYRKVVYDAICNLIMK